MQCSSRSSADSPRADVQDTSTTAKPVVSAPIHHAPDSHLSQRTGTHHTWLHSDVEGNGGQGRGVEGKEVVDGFELGVQGCLGRVSSELWS